MICKESAWISITEFHGYENLMIKEQKICQTYTFFSNSPVFRGVSKTPSAAYPLVPSLDGTGHKQWRYDVLMGSGACTPGEF